MYLYDIHQIISWGTMKGDEGPATRLAVGWLERLVSAHRKFREASTVAAAQVRAARR
jgi:hypothetical protein